MELESLVMAELENMDLNGVKIINLSCRAEATDISFEIRDMKIDFTTTNDNSFQVIALTHGNTVYTDEATLSKCHDWVKYVFAIVNPIIGKYRAELAEIPSTAHFDELKGEANVEEEGISAFNVSNERLEEAVDRGRKEGYKVARKKNVAEIKKLKKRYNIIIFFIVIILIAVFIIILYFYQTGNMDLPEVFSKHLLHINTL